MSSNSFYSRDELLDLGIKEVGSNVFISRKASLYGCSNMSIGSNVRIDDFCILSGNITIGSFVHISAMATLYGNGGIEIGSFCGVSPKSTIFSASDDFSGEYMISPMVDDRFTNVEIAKVTLKDYSHICSSSIVMPGVTLNQGAVLGAMSFAKKDLEEWSIYAGCPCKRIKSRKKDLLKLKEMLIKSL